MDRTEREASIARIMAERTGTRPEDWYCVYRARHGMLAACEAVRATIGEGHVVTQLLTCCTAVDPILAAGLIPRYGEVSADTASLDPAALPLDSSVRAVMLQHTFGLVDDGASRRIASAAHKAGALVFEDCAHGVARMAKGPDGSPLADVSFHSFGVEKMLHAQFGGAVWVNPEGASPEVLQVLRERLAQLPVTGAHLTALTGTFVFWNRVFNHLPLPVARGLRRFLSATGLFEPAVSDEERRGGVSHDPMRPSDAICDAVIEAFGCLDEDVVTRTEATRAYSELLADVPGVTLLSSAAQGPYQPLLKYPVLVADAATSDAVCEACCAAGHYMTVWYRPELGPGVLDESAYHVPVDRSAIPVCDDMVQRILTLPTNQGAEGARAVVDVLKGVVSS
ncbi:DegT/DnrJ/EryC1/StrS family aminotransferase [Collinsella phocaeensis]|uniref:DegT/DnrJ/EryC1/StrS family aminotransferase n=1 Tax=Collinsella phocaeensis TaxID=1871016 RepID=UPI000930DAD6|nr:DegT/DnrJ/EryC1/StrS family aminotransferase [Collinsella phocaeensis]